MSRTRKTATFLANLTTNVCLVTSGFLICYKVFGYNYETAGHHALFMVSTVVTDLIAAVSK